MSWVWVWVIVVGKKRIEKNCKIFIERKSPTPWLPFTPRRLLRPLPDISLDTCSPFTPSLPYMLPMEIYTYLSYRPKINDTDVSYTRSPSWFISTICRKYGINSCDSLNGSGCSLLIFIRFTIPMIGEDFLTRWNAITVGKGREKIQFWGISYVCIEVFLKEVLG